MLLSHWRRERISAKWPSVGDDLSEVLLKDANEVSWTPTHGKPLVLLAFSVECAHCVEIAPHWAAWIEEHGGEWEVKALSREPGPRAKRFIEQHGWRAKIVPRGSLGSIGESLTSRTPWVFITDPEGTIVAEGHGSRLPELSRTALTSLEARSRP